jgi:NADPH:quinone reductase-like Zn-dependent oxidoreductase
MSNQAAWIKSAKAKPLVVESAPYPTANPGEVVVKNGAVAVNPVDWKVQDYGFAVTEFPNVLGTDVAGTVDSVGEGVTRFKKGDRVLAHAVGLATGKAANGGFQLFTSTQEILVSKIPDSLTFTEATVLPLAISTAAAGLFQKTHLALPYPAKEAKKTGKTILVWGGSSSVGATAIQLAVAAGVEVATTASAKNHDFVKSLGATHVFDHTKSSVVDDIVSKLKSSEFVGTYDAIGTEETFKSSAKVTSKLGGSMVVGTLPPPASGFPDGVKVQGLFALTIASAHKEVGEAIWGKYVPEALVDGTLQAKPDPIVLGKGLEKVQEGLDKQKAGVSAGKIVIEL